MSTRQHSSVSQAESGASISSPSQPGSAVSQFPAYENEMAMTPSAMAVTFRPHFPHSLTGRPSYALGVQPSKYVILTCRVTFVDI